MKQVRIRIDDQLHRSVKECSAALGLTINDYVADAIRQRMANDAGKALKPIDAQTVGANAPDSNAPTENKKEKETKEEKNQKKKEELKEKTKEIHITRARAEEYFEDFWEAYPSNCPRKVNKRKCRDKFLRIFKPVENNREKMYELFIDMMAGLELWKASKQWANDGGEFIKAPLAWLNNENWEDHPLSYDDAMKNLTAAIAAVAKARAAAKASCEPTRPRPISISERERKKPSWMTWEQWQFEEAERMQNHRRNERVEQINEALKKVRKEFGIC